MVVYDLRFNYVSFPELDMLYKYVSRAQDPAHIGRSLGEIYLKLDGIPELADYMKHETDAVAAYHVKLIERIRLSFQLEIFNWLIRKPSDPTKIYFKAFLQNSHGINNSLIRIAVDYEDGSDQKITVKFDDVGKYFKLKFQFKQEQIRSYHDSESNVYSILRDDYYCDLNLFPGVEKYELKDIGSCRNFTFQVTENCSLRCSYCMPAGTKITMSDLSCKNIEDLKIGDNVLGFDEYPEPNRFRHLKETKVTHVFKRKGKCIRINSPKLDQPLIITPEHPILTNRGWKDAGKITTNEMIYMCDNLEDIEPIDINNIQYQTGYFIAAWLGDGCILDRNNCSDGYHRYFMRFVVKDKEMMDRMRTISKNIGFDFMDYPFKLSERNTEDAIRSNKKIDYERFQTLLLGNLSKGVMNRDRNFMAGYLAGLFDAEGSNDGMTIRFSNTDMFLLYWTQESLNELGFEFTMDKLSPTVNKIKTSIRILGGQLENIKFFRLVQPAIKRKGLINNLEHLDFIRIGNLEIVDLNKEYEVYNIETSSHTFVANDVLVHNCYQTCKSGSIMDYETACSAIDDLLAGRFEYLSPGFAKSIILDFIGGEPLLEIELIERIYEYFLQETYRLNHPWFHHHRMSMCSNGMAYFTKPVKKFFDRFARSTSFNISIDGNKALHDSCRIQPSGEGSYDVGIAGVLHAHDYYRIDISSKMTLAPSNIPFIKESVKNLCIDNPYPGINLNVVFEDVWAINDAKVLYDQMKSIADMVILYDRPELYFSIFRSAPLVHPKEMSDTLNNVCGGAGAMLSVSPDGKYYPCIRYMPSSLNGEARALVIGDTENKMEKDLRILREFTMITFISQQNDVCLSCPMSNICNWCTAYVYQVNGTANERTTFICDLIKAEYLASIYYWARMALHYPKYKINLDRQLAPYFYFEQIIEKDEYDRLGSMISEYNSIRTDPIDAPVKDHPQKCEI